MRLEEVLFLRPSLTLSPRCQVHGAAGVGADTPLAAFHAGARTLRLADGPDEVHLRDIGRMELKGAARL